MISIPQAAQGPSMPAHDGTSSGPSMPQRASPNSGAPLWISRQGSEQRGSRMTTSPRHATTKRRWSWRHEARRVVPRASPTGVFVDRMRLYLTLDGPPMIFPRGLRHHRPLRRQLDGRDPIQWRIPGQEGFIKSESAKSAVISHAFFAILSCEPLQCRQQKGETKTLTDSE
jgi:hypothetical protein